MKNLLVFISPTKSFGGIYGALTKIQIDNSLNLGWKRKDLLIVTNFPWKYNGIKTIVVGSEHYCVRPRSIKTTIIPYLIGEGIIEKGKLYWNHDLDAFEQTRINEDELELEKYDAGLTDYGWRERWCLGSFFIKDTSYDIFEKAKEIIYRDIEDETALVELTQNPKIAKRCKRLNITYNFGQRQIASNWERAVKPLRVVHFRPYNPHMPTMDIFVRGKNELRKPLVDRRLYNILKYHRIT